MSRNTDPETLDYKKLEETFISIIQTEIVDPHRATHESNIEAQEKQIRDDYDQRCQALQDDLVAAQAKLDENENNLTEVKQLVAEKKTAFEPYANGGLNSLRTNFTIQHQDGTDSSAASESQKLSTKDSITEYETIRDELNQATDNQKSLEEENIVLTKQFDLAKQTALSCKDEDALKKL